MNTAARSVGDLTRSLELHRSGLLIAALATCIGIGAALSQDILAIAIWMAFLFLMIFRIETGMLLGVLFIPFTPPLDTEFFVFRDVSTIGRYLMFLGVWIWYELWGGRLRWELGLGRLNPVLPLYLLVALASSTIVNSPSLEAKKALVRLFSYLCLCLAVAAWTGASANFRQY